MLCKTDGMTERRSRIYIRVKEKMIKQEFHMSNLNSHSLYCFYVQAVCAEHSSEMLRETRNATRTPEHAGVIARVEGGNLV